MATTSMNPYQIAPTGNTSAAGLLAPQQQVANIGNQQEQQAFNQNSQLYGTLSNAIMGLVKPPNVSEVANQQWAASGAGSPQGGAGTIPSPTAAASTAESAAAASQAAAFAKAKAQAGALGTSAVNTLRSELASRGILGGGTEARGLTDRLAAATNPLSDVNVAGLQENVGIAEQNQQQANQVAETGYQGQITQRGQNIQQQEAAAELAQQKALANQQLLTSMLTGISANLRAPGLSY